MDTGEINDWILEASYDENLAAYDENFDNLDMNNDLRNICERTKPFPPGERSASFESPAGQPTQAGSIPVEIDLEDYEDLFAESTPEHYIGSLGAFPVAKLNTPETYNFNPARFEPPIDPGGQTIDESSFVVQTEALTRLGLIEMTLGRMEKMEMERRGEDQQHIKALNEQIAELGARLAEHGAKIDKVQTGMVSFSKDTMRRLGRLNRPGVARAETS